MATTTDMDMITTTMKVRENNFYKFVEKNLDDLDKEEEIPANKQEESKKE